MTNHPNRSRLYTFAEIATLPNRGIRTATEYWGTGRDRGGDWVVIERPGHYDHSGEHRGMLYRRSGLVVAYARSERGARNRAGRALSDYRRQGLPTLVDVVPRDAVAISTTSRSARSPNDD